MKAKEVADMVGVTMVSVTGAVGGDTLYFVGSDGRSFRFEHHQDCCENVRIEDICGDLGDLVGSPIVLAEEVTNADEPPPPEHADSYTWTFYRFATTKGTVTVRWLGESNGCYGEGVDFDIDEPPRCEVHEDCREHPALGVACLEGRRTSEARSKP